MGKPSRNNSRVTSQDVTGTYWDLDRTEVERLRAGLRNRESGVTIRRDAIAFEPVVSVGAWCIAAGVVVPGETMPRVGLWATDRFEPWSVIAALNDVAAQYTTFERATSGLQTAMPVQARYLDRILR